MAAQAHAHLPPNGHAAARRCAHNRMKLKRAPADALGRHEPMDEDTEKIVEWLAETENWGWDPPDGLGREDFLRAWVEIAADPPRLFAPLTADQVDDLVNHAGMYMDFAVWWDTDNRGEGGDPSLKIAAIRASPAILRAASQATAGRCPGCLMFWEHPASVWRDIRGWQDIWAAIGETLRDQLASAPDDCVKQSAEHGIEHWERTEAEGR